MTVIGKEAPDNNISPFMREPILRRKIAQTKGPEH